MPDYWRTDISVDASLDPVLRPGPPEVWRGDDLQFYERGRKPLSGARDWLVWSWSRPIGGLPGFMPIDALPDTLLTLVRWDDPELATRFDAAFNAWDEADQRGQR